MRYGDARAFRAALEIRLNREATNQNVSVSRLRKSVVIERLMARLLTVAPECWIVKGGVALDLRFGRRARFTRDLDLTLSKAKSDAVAHILSVEDVDLGDFFVFSLWQTGALDALPEKNAIRFQVRVTLADRLFEQIHLDVGYGDRAPAVIDILPGPSTLDFAGITSTSIPTLTLEQHLAEKLHAYTRSYANARTSTRVKDLIDIVLISATSRINASQLRLEIDQAFHDRATHALPPTLPRPPEAWTNPYRALALEVGLAPDISDGYQMAAQFLDPVLTVAIIDEATWNPTTCLWLRP